MDFFWLTTSPSDRLPACHIAKAPGSPADEAIPDQLRTAATPPERNIHEIKILGYCHGSDPGVDRDPGRACSDGELVRRWRHAAHVAGKSARRRTPHAPWNAGRDLQLQKRLILRHHESRILTRTCRVAGTHQMRTYHWLSRQLADEWLQVQIPTGCRSGTLRHGGHRRMRKPDAIQIVWDL